MKVDTDKFVIKNAISNRNWFYPWDDSRGHHEVKISVELPPDFKTPYLGQERHWAWFQKCTVIKNHKGWVRVRVSRYDNEAKAGGLLGLMDLLNWNKTITSVAEAHYDTYKEEKTATDPDDIGVRLQPVGTEE